MILLSQVFYFKMCERELGDDMRCFMISLKAAFIVFMMPKRKQTHKVSKASLKIKLVQEIV